MNLIVITQNGCDPCQRVKNYLNDEDVQFETVNINEDRSAIDKYGVMSAPVTILMDEDEEVARVIGYQESEIDVLISQL